MWTVKSESGTLRAILVQDSVEHFWGDRLPFVGIESNPLYLPRCPHAQFDRGHGQWKQLPEYLAEEGVQVFEVISILKRVLDGATIQEKRRIVESVWKGMPRAPRPDELTVDHMIRGYPSEPFFDASSDRIVLPDFKRVAWPYPRDTSFTTQVGTVICSMRRNSRRHEPLVVKLVYEHDPVLREKVDVIWDANEDSVSSTEPLCIEGGDVHVIDEETIAIGVGQRSTFTGFVETARNLFEQDLNEDLRYVCAVKNPDYPAVDYMHLDVVINYPGKGKALVMPYYFDSEVVGDMPSKRLLLKVLEAVREQSEKAGWAMEPLVHPNNFEDAGRCAVYERSNGVPRLVKRELSLIDFLVKEEKLDVDGLIYVGGMPKKENDVGHLMSALMEQARGASNIVAIKSDLVVAYERNEKTNEELRAYGVRVKEWDDAYLDMLGGPHCSTSPLSRDAN